MKYKLSNVASIYYSLFSISNEFKRNVTVKCEHQMLSTTFSRRRLFVIDDCFDTQPLKSGSHDQFLAPNYSSGFVSAHDMTVS